MKRAAAADKHLGLQMTLAQSWSPSGIGGGFNSLFVRLLGFGVREWAPTRQSQTHQAPLTAKGDQAYGSPSVRNRPNPALEGSVHPACEHQAPRRALGQQAPSQEGPGTGRTPAQAAQPGS